MRDGKCPYPRVAHKCQRRKRRRKTRDKNRIFEAALHGLWRPESKCFNVEYNSCNTSIHPRSKASVDTVHHVSYIHIPLPDHPNNLPKRHKSPFPKQQQQQQAHATTVVQLEFEFRQQNYYLLLRWSHFLSWGVFFHFLCSCASCENVGPTWTPKRSCFVDYKFPFNTQSV